MDSPTTALREVPTVSRQVLAIVLLLFAPPLAAQEEPEAPAEPAPDTVDLRLKIVSATMNHRLLVYESCVDGSCASESFLQWFKTEWEPAAGGDPDTPLRLILETCPVAELTGDLLVHQAYWRTGVGDPELVTELSPPAAPSERTALGLTPGRPCDYRVEPQTSGD